MEWTSDGKLVPKIDKMDGSLSNGTQKYYKTLLTDKFEAYYVEGFVTETPKTKGDSSLKPDQVVFGIAKSENYDNIDFSLQSFEEKKNVQDLDKVVGDDARQLTVYVGDTDAADYEGVYAAAIIMVDEYDDLVILSFQPSGKNKTLKFDADLYDEDENEDFASGKVKYLNIFASESATKPTKYNLEAKDDALTVALYINGSKTENATAKDIHDALINAVGDVELVDTYKTNGYYDALYVNVYETAQIETVMTSQNKIIFNNKSTKKSLTLDPDDDKLVYNIYYNGGKINFAELKKDDVLSIAYAGTDFNKANHYDIYVSRTVETGKLTGISKNDKTVTIGGKEYKFVGAYDDKAPVSDDMGNEYTVYEDYFGRIFDYELNVSSAKYAVVDKAIYNSSDENLRMTMYTADGESKVLVLDGTKATIKVDGEKKSFTKTETKTAKKALEDFVQGKVYIDGNLDKARQSIDTRVAKYKVSTSTGRVTELDFITGTKGEGTYKASTGAIGSVKVGDATKVIDAIKYSSAATPQYTDLAIASRNSFVADTDYVVYGYGDKVDGYHPFVLAIEGAASYNAETRFAVIADTITDAQDEAGEPIYKIPALYFGGEGTDNTVVKELIAGDDLVSDKIDTLKKDLVLGDIIVFTTDGKGYIDDFEVIFNPSNDGKEIANYQDLVDMALIDDNDTELFKNKVVALPAGNASDAWIASWDASESKSDEPIQLIFGPVVTSNSKSFGIGKISDMKTDLNKNHKEVAGVYEIDLDSDTAVYEYDYDQAKKNRLSVASAASIRASIIVNNNNDEDIIDWAYNSAGKDEPESLDNQKNVNFAFALVVDGTARDVLVFNAK